MKTFSIHVFICNMLSFHFIESTVEVTTFVFKCLLVLRQIVEECYFVKKKNVFPFLFQSVSYKTAHAVTQVDCQPVIDGSIMVVVLGQVKVCNSCNFIQDLNGLKNL